MPVFHFLIKTLIFHTFKIAHFNSPFFPSFLNQINFGQFGPIPINSSKRKEAQMHSQLVATRQADQIYGLRFLLKAGKVFDEKEESVRTVRGHKSWTNRKFGANVIFGVEMFVCKNFFAYKSFYVQFLLAKNSFY
jgi:hypothetical protein